MGDLMDNATRSSVSFSYGATSPQKELEMLVEVLSPVATRVDLAIPGNHERRSADRGDGLDVTAQLTSLIGVPDVYRPQCTVIRYQFNKRRDKYYRTSVEIMCHHGRGGGRRPGGKINSVSSLTELKSDCNIYCHGHVHMQSTHLETAIIGWKPRVLRQYFVMTGCWLGAEPYASDQAYPAPTIGSPVIHISSENDEPVVKVVVR